MPFLRERLVWWGRMYLLVLSCLVLPMSYKWFVGKRRRYQLKYSILWNRKTKLKLNAFSVGTSRLVGSEGPPCLVLSYLCPKNDLLAKGKAINWTAESKNKTLTKCVFWGNVPTGGVGGTSEVGRSYPHRLSIEEFNNSIITKEESCQLFVGKRQRFQTKCLFCGNVWAVAYTVGYRGRRDLRSRPIIPTPVVVSVFNGASPRKDPLAMSC